MWDSFVWETKIIVWRNTLTIIVWQPSKQREFIFSNLSHLVCTRVFANRCELAKHSIYFCLRYFKNEVHQKALFEHITTQAAQYIMRCTTNRIISACSYNNNKFKEIFRRTFFTVLKITIFWISFPKWVQKMSS